MKPPADLRLWELCLAVCLVMLMAAGVGAAIAYGDQGTVQAAIAGAGWGVVILLFVLFCLVLA